MGLGEGTDSQRQATAPDLIGRAAVAVCHQGRCVAFSPLCLHGTYSLSSHCYPPVKRRTLDLSRHYSPAIFTPAVPPT